jgi:hypothetical protein
MESLAAENTGAWKPDLTPRRTRSKTSGKDRQQLWRAPSVIRDELTQADEYLSGSEPLAE